MSKSRLILAALAVAGALGAGAAQAHDDVQWSVTIGAPVGVPVYAQPAYTPPPPQYRVVAPAYPEMRYHQPTRWDRDGDGIPNWRDPVYNPRWDRDGDGIPDWRDRHPDHPGWHEARRDWRDDHRQADPRDHGWDRGPGRDGWRPYGR